MEQYPIGCLLKMITDKIKIQADASLAQHDLTLTQSRVLGCLARNGGTATQKEIEGFLQVSQATIAAAEQQMLRSLSPKQIAALEDTLRTIYADLG